MHPGERVLSHGSGAVPRGDPLVQEVIGQLSSTTFVATLAAREVARGLGATPEDLFLVRNAKDPA